MQRCISTTEEDNEPVYSGLYRQGVFICEWSLIQVLLYVHRDTKSVLMYYQKYLLSGLV